MFPPWLRPGDAVRVVAPSGPFEPRLLWRAMGWLKERYEVRWDRRIFSRSGYLAGDDEGREREFVAALDEPGVAAIFCARGGYGGNRFAHRIDWQKLRRTPRWIVGFSDVTALHVEAATLHVGSVHGPNMTGLGRGDARARAQTVRLLETGRMGSYSLEELAGGEARGPLVGGNLCLLHSCAAAGRLALPTGAVVLLEEIGEWPYRIDRMLTTLVNGGHFDGAAGFVIGDLDQCGPARDGVAALDVVASCLAPLGVPVMAGIPVGHRVHNEPVLFGAEVTLRAGTLAPA